MWRRTSTYPLLLTFFGLTPEHRKYVLDQVHQIVFHGQGGYSFADVYQLPIHLRKYIFHKIKQHYDEQNNQNDDPEKLAGKIKSGQVQVPDFMKGKKIAYNG